MRLAIPDRFASARVALLDPRYFGPVIDYSRRLHEEVSAGNGLMLLGAAGRGKSFSLAALTYHFWREAKKDPKKFKSSDYIFVTAPEFFDLVSVVGEARDEWRKKDFIDSFSTTPWLFVDDLGKEYRGGKLSEQIPHKLGRILRARSQNMLPTFITTNLDVEGFEATYGESIVSLLRENTEAFVVGGKDLRVRAKMSLVQGGKR